MKAGESFFRRIAAQFAFAPIAIADFDLRTGEAHRFPLPTIHQAIAFSPPRFSDMNKRRARTRIEKVLCKCGVE